RALELYLQRDEAAEMQRWDRRVQRVLDAVADLPGVEARRQLPAGIGQLVPHALVSWDEGAMEASPGEVARRVRAGSPRLIVQVVSPGSRSHPGSSPALRIHPHTLQDGEAEVVARRLREELVAA